MALLRRLGQSAVNWLWRVRAQAVLGGAIFILVIAFLASAADPIDNLLSQLRDRVISRAPSGDVVVVEIDARSLRDAQEWPWPRANFARAIANLRHAGANIIGFDVDFSARSTPDNDAALERAIEADPGAVVLPAFLQRSGEANVPLASLSRDAVLASVNVVVDRDGQARHYNRGFHIGSRYYSSMAEVLAGSNYGNTEQFLIDYGIDWRRIDRLSFTDILNNRFDPRRVRGKVVLVGATALELGDKFATPVYPALPGVYVHALALESLTQGRTLLAPRAELALVLALVVLGALWPRRQKLRLRTLAARHVTIFVLLVVGPFAAQALTPLSFNVGLPLLAQLMCVALGVRRELDHRAAELITQREAHLRYIAHHDPETALPNRRALLDALAQAANPAQQGVVVLSAVGVDRFSVLRGAVGYANANKIIAQLAQRLAEEPCVSGVYLVSTSILGVIALTPNEEQARSFARRCANPAREFAIDGILTDLSVRAGVAMAPCQSAIAEKLLEAASVALDHARRQKRRIAYADETAVDPRLQLAVLSDVRRGIERGDFKVLYQPKATARDSQVVGAEALLRWRHPTHGPIAPDVFIAAAEDTGAINELSLWMLRRVVDDQVQLRRAGVDLRLSVNVSARSLVDMDFCRDVLEVIAAHGAKICVEITETAVIEDPVAAIASIAAFKAAGVGISIDDFGAGLSSLSYLKQIAADEVKLDRSLIRDLNSSQRDRLILKSTIDLAHGLDMKVCAEGVEGPAEWAIVTSLGCDVVQGFLLSKPLERPELIAFCMSDSSAGRTAYQAG